MRVALTDAALADINEILEYLSHNYPSSTVPFEKSLNLTLTRIGDFPKSAPLMKERDEVRTTPLNRYPYKVFYRIVGSHVEVLYIHHAARNELGEK